MTMRAPLLFIPVIVAIASAANAQSTPKKCHVLCAPSFALWTEMHRSHPFDNPEFRDLASGNVSQLPSKNNLMLLLLTSVPTQVPRLSLVFDVSWVPTAKSRTNPFTEFSASALGDDITANLPSIAGGVSYTVMTKKQTRGWVDLTPYVNDLFSKASRPDDESDYTHKLDLGLTTTIGVFSALPKTSWLHGVRLVGNLDWVATGLPNSGDEIPKGERVFLDDVDGLSLAFGVALPIAPLP